MRLKNAMLVIAPLILLARNPGYSQTAAAAPIPPAAPPAQNVVEAQVLNLRSSQGVVRCAVWNSPNGFPRVASAKFAGVSAAIDSNNSTCVFKGLPPGTYAMAILADTNNDGHMDFDLLGLPTKGYGFSNNVKGLLGPPSFEAASFRYDGGKLTLPIRLYY
ncbi:MAG TPA: DUF2141 domain-containing protein [Candidatus Binataceae bacterium]|jgi:uncharacterized protein (DUF2141 family)